MADDRGRFPRSVFEEGEDPDPRFSLANERTFLAWIRTGLAFVAAGLAVEALQLPVTERKPLPNSLPPPKHLGWRYYRPRSLM